MAAARRNKIPAKVKSYWCWGCKYFDVVNYDTRDYYCRKKEKSIRPPEEQSCKLRNVEDFVTRTELLEQLKLEVKDEMS